MSLATDEITPTPTPVTTPTVATTVSGVIEKIPLGGTHYTLLAAASMGYLFDCFDTYTVSFAMPAIAKEWTLNDQFKGVLTSAGMWGMFIGAMSWGPIADRFGRKLGFAATVLGFSLVSGLTAFSTGTTSFVLFRFISGLFLGGMLPVVSALMAEFVSARQRGRFVIIPPIFWPVGWLACAIASRILVAHYGWRSLFLVGVLPAFLAFFVVLKIPESPRWLATKGKRKQAGDVLVRLGAAESDVQNLASEHQPHAVPVSLLLRPPYLMRFTLTTSVLFFGFFGYYGFLLMVPSLLTSQFNFPQEKMFTFLIYFAICAFLGKVIAFLIIDRFGRKPIFYFGFGLASIASLVFGLLRGDTALLVGGCILSLLLEMAAAGCVVLPTELFPSHVRVTANAWSSASGKLASAISPLVFGFFMQRQLHYGIFICMAVCCWIVCILVLTIGVETRGKSLHDVGAS